MILSVISAKRKLKLTIAFTISISRSPHGQRQLELYSPFRCKCQSNVNLIMLIRWQGVLLIRRMSEGRVSHTSLLQYIIFSFSLTFILFQGFEITLIWTREISGGWKIYGRSYLPKRNNNLLNVKQPALQSPKWSLWRRSLLANQRQALICTRYILRQVSLASEAIGLIY